MARTYTKSTIQEEDINRADKLNKELDGSYREINGRFDQHNMPLRTVTDAILVDRTVTTVSETTGAHGPINSYFISSNSPVAGPWEWDIGAGEWKIGWNDFADKMGVNGAEINFDAKEGMIKGWATFDIERRGARGTVDGTPTPYGYVNWFEVGVFVNGVLTARTGKIYPRRLTFDLPFSLPVGNEVIKVELKWRGIEERPGPGAVGYDAVPFTVHNSVICCRNQKR